jgi:WD40 repeat protein
VAFTPDGTMLASAGDGPAIRDRDRPRYSHPTGVVKVWDVATATERACLEKPTQGVVPVVAFSADGKVLFSSGNTTGKNLWTPSESELKLWDTATWRERAILKGHPGTTRCVAFTAGALILISGDGAHDLSLKVWRVATEGI